MGVAGSEQKAVPVMLDCIVEALPACLKCPVPGVSSSVGLGQPTPSESPLAAAWKADAPMHLPKGLKFSAGGNAWVQSGRSTIACG